MHPTKSAFEFTAYLLPIFFLTLVPNFGFSQEQGMSDPMVFSILANLDVFYSYDFNKPENSVRVPFMVNHNRHNEFNLNLGTVGFSLENNRFYANLSLQSGTYVNDNYANESDVIKTIHDANVGMALTRNGKLWLDAGILGSHIGFENLIGMEALTVTRSLMVEMVPYYLSGARLTYQFNPKWEAMIMVTNGWQRIQRVEGNSMLSYATKLRFTPSKKVQLQWNTFIGTDDPDTNRRMRYFNDFFIIITPSTNWELKAGFDFGLQQNSKGSSKYNPWFTASLLARYHFSKLWFLGLRTEYVNDKYNVVIENPSPNEFKLFGWSANIDYQPTPYIMARVEARYWISENAIFVKDDTFVSDDFFITFSLTAHFGKEFDLDK